MFKTKNKSSILSKILFESNNKAIINFIKENEKKFNPSFQFNPKIKFNSDSDINIQKHIKIPQLLNNKKVIFSLSNELENKIPDLDKNKLFDAIGNFFQNQNSLTINLNKNMLIDFKKNLIEEIPDILLQSNIKNISTYKLLPTLKIKNINDKVINLELDFNYNPDSHEKNISIKGNF
jgi:hypothetical protein